MRISEYISLDEYINDSFRILLLIGKTSERKSNVMDLARIIVLDYYLKFPNSMISDSIDNMAFEANFDEFYSFFHWKPDWDKYTKCISFLVSKGLLTSELSDNTRIFIVTEIGKSIISEVSNNYTKRIGIIIAYLNKNIVSLSNKLIEEDIALKSNLLKKFSAL